MNRAGVGNLGRPLFVYVYVDFKIFDAVNSVRNCKGLK